MTEGGGQMNVKRIWVKASCAPRKGKGAGAESVRKELETEYAALAARLEKWHDELSRRPTRAMLVSVPAAVYGWIASEAEFLDVNPGEFVARVVKVAYDVAKGVK